MVHEIGFQKDPHRIYFIFPGDVRIATNYPNLQSYQSLQRLVRQVYEQGLKDGGLAAATVTQAPSVELPLPFSVVGGS